MPDTGTSSQKSLSWGDIASIISTIYGVYRGSHPRAPQFANPPMTPEEQKLWDFYLKNLMNPSLQNNATDVNNASHQILNGYSGLHWTAPQTSKGETGYPGSNTSFSPIPAPGTNPTTPHPAPEPPPSAGPPTPPPTGGPGGAPPPNGLPFQNLPVSNTATTPQEIQQWMKDHPGIVTALGGPVAALSVIMNYVHGGGGTQQLPTGNRNYTAGDVTPGGSFTPYQPTDQTNWDEYFKGLADKGMDNSQAGSTIASILGSQDSGRWGKGGYAK